MVHLIVTSCLRFLDSTQGMATGRVAASLLQIGFCFPVQCLLQPHGVEEVLGAKATEVSGRGPGAKAVGARGKQVKAKLRLERGLGDRATPPPWSAMARAPGELGRMGKEDGAKVVGAGVMEHTARALGARAMEPMAMVAGARAMQLTAKVCGVQQHTDRNLGDRTILQLWPTTAQPRGTACTATKPGETERMIKVVGARATAMALGVAGARAMELMLERTERVPGARATLPPPPWPTTAQARGTACTAGEMERMAKEDGAKVVGARATEITARVHGARATLQHGAMGTARATACTARATTTACMARATACTARATACTA